MAHQQEIAHVTLGILGNVASCAFFLSSAPTVLKMLKRRSLGGISGDLYAFKLFNCLLWTLYGLPMVHPHNFWWSIIWKLAMISSAFIIVVMVLLLLEHTKHVRTLVIGILCVTISSCMHLTLLSQLRMTVTTKDSRYMHPKASVAAFMKGAIWTAYGIVDLDVYIVIPNGVGIAIGFVQILVGVYLISEMEKAKQDHIPSFVISNQRAVEELMEKGGATLGDYLQSSTNKEEHEVEQNVGHVASNLQIRGVVVPIDDGLED